MRDAELGGRATGGRSRRDTSERIGERIGGVGARSYRDCQRAGRAALEMLDPRWSALPRIDPGITSGQGRPEYSYVIYKLLGEGPIWGARMPLGRAPLSDAQTRLVVDWVTAGAPDN